MRYRGVVAARGREGVGGDLWLVDPTELCALAERPGDRGWTAVGGSGQWAVGTQFASGRRSSSGTRGPRPKRSSEAGAKDRYERGGGGGRWVRRTGGRQLPVRSGLPSLRSRARPSDGRGSRSPALRTTGRSQNSHELTRGGLHSSGRGGAGDNREKGGQMSLQG